MRQRWAPTVATFLVTAVVLGPLYLHRGIALRGDMVFVPDQPWKRAGLGLDGSVPRAVPMDALVSLLDEVLPGALLQRLLLTAALVAGGLGIARLTARWHWVGGVAAVAVYLWNPWVAERLAIGQWPTVLGYGLLPWLVSAGGRVREREPGGWAATTLLLTLSAACAPSTGLLAAGVAVAVVAPARRPRQLLALVGIGVVANLPWMVPAVLGPGLHASGSQFGAFAARGESRLGTLASLVSMGGIWKTSVVPPERTNAVVVGAAAVLAVVLLASFCRYAAPVLGRRTTTGIAAAGAAGLVLALLPAVGPVAQALGSLSEHWPALGVLRDSHRYLAPLGLVLAVGAAALVDRLLAGPRPDDVGRRSLGWLLLIAPVALLPSLVWGLAGGLRPAVYPDEWNDVATRITGPGATVVLPWTGSYRGFGWNADRAVLDPAPRFLPGDVLIDDRIFLRHQVIAGEDPFLARVGRALDEGPEAASGGLRALGVRWVVVEKGNGVDASVVPVGRVVEDGRWLRLVDLGGPSAELGRLRPAPPTAPVVLADLLTAIATCVSVVQLARHSAHTRR